MKKAKVVITTKSGKEKNVEVWIDDETLRLLDECGDERVKDLYLREEYRAQLIERRETRRHQSLEKSIENGHEIQDDGSNIVEFLETKEEITQLYKVLKILTEKQLYVLKLHVLERKTFREISEEMGLNLYTVYEHYTAAKKKVKKIF